MLLYLILAGVAIYFLIQHLTSKRPPAPKLHILPPNRHAIVIGGGIGGLLTAGVLSKHFEKVTLYDRDSLGDATKPRKFVPQGNQLHAMLTGGARACERIFPGLLREIMSAGASTLHFGEISLWMKHFWMASPRKDPKTDCDLTLLCASRLLWERTLLNRVRALRNVEIIDNIIVTGLMESDGSVVGIKVNQDGNVSEKGADFVADASGRSSKIDSWIQEIGYGPIPAEEYDAGLGYQTATYDMPDGVTEVLPGVRAALSVPQDDKTRTGLVWPMENRQYMAFFGCYAKDYPPNNVAELEKWATGIAHNEPFMKVIREWVQVKPFVSYHPPPSRWRHMERAARWPQNLVCVGDTVAGFNPVFAQGMTHATLHALALDEILTEQRKTRFSEGWWWVAQDYNKRASQVSKACWDLGAPADLARPGTVGQRTFVTKFASILGAELLQMLMSTEAGSIRFARLQQCISSPEQVVGSPDVLFPLIVRTVKAFFVKKPSISA